MIANKFNSEEELVKAYHQLEKEFTKKSQELASLKREKEERARKSDEELSQEFDEFCPPKEVEEVQPVEQKSFLKDAELEACEAVTSEYIPPEDENILQENGNISLENFSKDDDAENPLVPNSEVLGYCYNNVEFRKKANEFLNKGGDAKRHAKAIAKVLLQNKDILRCKDPLFVAYTMALGQDVLDKGDRGEVESREKEMSFLENDEKKGGKDLAIGDKVVDVTLLSGSGVGSAPRGIKRRCTTLEEAGEEVLKQYF